MLDAVSLDALALDTLSTEVGTATALASAGTGRAVDYVYIAELYPWQGVNGTAYGAPWPFDAGALDALPGLEEQPPGSVVPLYVADRGYLTSRTDATAPRRLYEGRLEGFSVERRLPLSPTDANRVAATFGTLTLRNDDGALDGMPDSFAIAGRRVVVKRLVRGDALSNAVPVFDGVGGAWVPGVGTLGLTVRDKTAAAELPLLPLYGGTGGKDGPSGWAGKVIPGAFGVCRWVPLEFYDTAYGLARVHFQQIAGVDGVWDKGGAYSYAGDCATEAVLKAASITGGQYATCLAEGLVRAVPAGGTFSGTVTADVRGDAAGGYTDTHAGIARRLLTMAGLGPILGRGSFDSMAAVYTGSAGFYFGSQTTVAAAVSAVLAGCAAWWGDDRTGAILTGRLQEPDTPTLLLGAGDILDLEPTPLPDSVSPAVWRSTCLYQRCYAVQSRSQLLTTAAESIKAFAEREWRTGPASVNATLLTRYPTAPELTLQTGFDGAGPAGDLASFLQQLYARSRVAFAVKVPIEAAAALYLGRTVRLSWPRHGLAQGRNMRVVALPEDIGDRTATVILWG